MTAGQTLNNLQLLQLHMFMVFQEVSELFFMSKRVKG